MNDYVVYSINVMGNYYIGSTNDLERRIYNHKSDCYNKNKNSYNVKLYKFIREAEEKYEFVFDKNCFDVEMVILNCDRQTGRKYERQIFEEIKSERLEQSKQMLNEKNPMTNKEELKQRVKAYYKTNKEEIKQYHKAYRETNKEELKQYKKAYYEADKEEINRKKREYYKTNKEEINRKAKAYREVNKEEIKQRGKARYDANKEEINRKRREKYQLKRLNR